MAQQKDAFADLFAPKRKDTSKLSLAERQKLTGSSSQRNGSSWAGLDVLSNSGSSTPLSRTSTSGDLVLPGLSAPNSQFQAQAVNTSSSSTTSKLSYLNLDDIFGLGVGPSVTPAPLVAQNNTGFARPEAKDEIDDLFAVFNTSKPEEKKPALAQNTPSISRKETPPPKAPRPRKTAGFQHDDVLPQRPSRSRSLTPSKDVHRLFDGLAKKPEDLNGMVNEISSELLSSASSLFSKGREALAKNIERYQAQKRAEHGGQPAWMSEKNRYMAKGWREEDEDIAIDFDGSVIKTTDTSSNASKRFVQSPDLPEHPEDRKIFNRKPEKPKTPERPRQNADIFTEPPKQFATAPPTKTAPEPEATLNIFEDLTIAPGGALFSAPKARTTNEPDLPSNTLMRFKQYRSLGSNFFKEGNYESALLNYKDALKLLPPKHSLLIIAYSNLTTSYVKVGDSKNALESADRGLEVIKSFSLDDVIEDGKSVKEFFVKLNLKKAEVLEASEKYKEALECYKLVLENGGATKSAIEGKRRCIDAITPKRKSAPIKKSSNGASSSGAAVRKIKEENAKQESLEQQKYLLHDTVQQKIDTWKHGKEDNIRALLVSLDTILWPETNWKKVSLPDLVLDKKVKINYMKAVAKTHPDKINSNATVEQQMIAQGVFVALNKAWDVFKQQNGIN